MPYVLEKNLNSKQVELQKNLFPITKSRQSKIIDFPEPVSPVKTFRPLEKNISAFSINNIFVMESDFINFNQP